MRIRLTVNALLLLAPLVAAQSERQLNLMPMPSSITTGTGELRINRSFSVQASGVHDAILDRSIQRFISQLSRQTGTLLEPTAVQNGSARLVISAGHSSEAVQKLGEDESYELTVGEVGAKLSAPNTLGILHGLQTFLQLVETGPNGFSVPSVTIKDRPRFAWRGLLIDVGRHYIPVDVLKHNLDGMAAVKMNVLHLHLSDDQGFRVESRKFPKLHEMGSDGLYYKQDELRDLVAYARDRGIRIVPEFD